MIHSFHLIDLLFVELEYRSKFELQTINYGDAPPRGMGFPKGLVQRREQKGRSHQKVKAGNSDSAFFLGGTFYEFLFWVRLFGAQRREIDEIPNI